MYIFMNSSTKNYEKTDVGYFLKYLCPIKKGGGLDIKFVTTSAKVRALIFRIY